MFLNILGDETKKISIVLTEINHLIKFVICYDISNGKGKFEYNQKKQKVKELIEKINQPLHSIVSQMIEMDCSDLYDQCAKKNINARNLCIEFKSNN